MRRSGRRICWTGLIVAALLQPDFAEPPKFQVDPTWPLALPSNWIIGTIGGIYVDAQDHIWINQRPSSLDAREKRASTATNVICCVPAPPVIEFDQAGKVVQAGVGMAPITSGATTGTASSSITTISSGSPTMSRTAGTSTNSPATASSSC